MLTCQKVREQLPDFSVELLDRRSHGQVEAHLALCDDCRRELRALDAAVSLFEQHGGLNPPVGLFNAVRNRIEAGEIVRERRPWWFWFNSTPARTLAMGMAVLAIAVPLALPSAPAFSPVATLPMHDEGPGMTSSALASSIRQHAISAGEGPLTDRVTWEAMAQIATQDRVGEAPAVRPIERLEVN